MTFCLLLLSLWESVVQCSVFCCTLLYVHSSFAIILMSIRELVALHIVFPILVSRDGYVALPRGAMSLPAVCDCGISRSYSLTMFVGQTMK